MLQEAEELPRSALAENEEEEEGASDGEQPQGQQQRQRLPSWQSVALEGMPGVRPCQARAPRLPGAAPPADTACLQVEGRMPDSAYPLRMLQTISRHLYVDRGFKGNTEVRLWEHALSAGAAAMPCAPAGRILMLRCCRPFLASQQRPYRKTSASSHLDHCRTTTIRTTAASIACWRRAGASQSRWHWCTCRCIGGACGGAVQ